MKLVIALQRVGLCLLLALVVTGCAFGTRKAVLVYPPAEPSKEAAAKEAPPARGTLVLGKIDDDRSDQALVGHVRNGWGMKTAKVVLETNAAEFVAYALRTELSKDGWTILNPVQASASANAPNISGSLLVLYCDAYMSYEGKATLMLRVSRGDNEVFRKTFTGEGSVGMNWAATGASYGRSLSLAVRDAIDEFKRSLPVALKQ